MKNNKVKAFLFLFLILLFCAAVNAESIDDTAAYSNPVMVSIESYADTVTIDNSALGTFSELNKTINGAESTNNGNVKEVQLNQSYKYNSSSDSAFQQGINITSNMTIDGNGNTIDANNESCIFNVLEGITLTIKNIKLINGNTVNAGDHKNGSAIRGLEGSYITVVNSTFENNRADIRGGAIYSTGNVTVINSTFTENYANGTGGAIRTDYGANLTVINSTFVGNSAFNHGGAISTGVGNLYVINSIFHNNTATGGNGGALSSTNLTVINSTFENNSASGDGGAIMANNGGHVNVTDSTFNNNSATNGGVISSGTGDVHVNNSTFTNNTAENGGAIHSVSGNMNITDSDFHGNAADNGGAIYGDNGNMTVSNSDFNQNSAKNGGGIYYTQTNSTTDDSSLEVTDSNFVENSGDFGDDIYTSHNTTISGNNYTKDSEANVYANNTIIKGSIVTVLNNGTYYVTPNEKFRLNATVIVDGTAIVGGYVLTISNGTHNYTTKYLGHGVYVVEMEFVVNSTFRSQLYTAYLNDDTTHSGYIVRDAAVIVNRNITIEIDLDEVSLEKNLTGNLTIRDAKGNIANITGEVTLEINGKNYTTNVTEGKGTFDIPNDLEPGKYTITATIPESENYNSATDSENFTLIDIILDVEDLTKYYGNDGKLNITIRDTLGNPLANQTVYITINGVTYTYVTDENGRIEMAINLIPGVYETTVTYGNITKEVTVTVKTTIISEDLIKYYLNGTHFYATFYNTDGTLLANTNVTFSIHGVLYTRQTDENGVARLNITLYPGEYILTTENPVNKENKSFIVTVLTTIIGYDVVKYFKNGTNYYVVCLDLDGNPLVNRNVTFNVHGVFYNRTTDENGIARLNINLNPGEYIITAVNPVNNQTYANTIKVLSVVVSKNIVMYDSDRKPFKVTILGDHGAPLANANVVFNIHGIFYNETTDENGDIYLNINLIPGKYIVTTMYNGYNVSNTIIILV